LYSNSIEKIWNISFFLRHREIKYYLYAMKGTDNINAF